MGVLVLPFGPACAACPLGWGGVLGGIFLFHLAEDAQHLLAYGLQLQAQVLQHAGGHAFLFADQAQQDVFGADVGMAHVLGLFHGVFQHFLGAGGERDLAQQHHVVAGAHDLFDLGPDLAQVYAQVLEDLGGHALRKSYQAQQDMLGADIVVVEALGLFLRYQYHALRPVSKSCSHFEASVAI